MGAIGGMLGLNGGANGTGFAGPSQAPIDQATTAAQANTAYDTAQGALSQQQQFAQAVQAQNGLGNQTSVFNQLQGVANGTGPNPAQAQLQQATGANVANQAALMAGQRGSNANAGLIARQAAMQGANTQQQSIGQAATLQANQSLNALSGLGNLATQQVGQQANATSAYTQAAQGEQQNILNAIGGQNSALAGVQSSINSSNAALAGQSMQQQGNLLGNITGGIGSAFNLAEGGKVPPRQYYANQGNVTPVPQAGGYAPIDPNAPDVFDPSKTNAGAPVQAPVAIQAPAAAVPSAVQSAPQAASNTPPTAASGPKSNVAKHMANWDLSQKDGSNPSQLTGASMAGNTIGKAIGTGLKALFGSSAPSGGQGDASSSQEAYGNIGGDTAIGTQAQQEMDKNAASDPSVNLVGPHPGTSGQTTMDMNSDGQANAARGGKVPAMVSPGERYLPPSEVAAVKAGKKNPMQAGEKIPGTPKVKGSKDSYANDTVPKTLEAGGLVLPRSVTESKHPHWEAMKFVQAHMAKGGKVLPKKPKVK